MKRRHDTSHAATLLVYDGMWRAGGIQSIITRVILNKSSREEAIWLVCTHNGPNIGIPGKYVLPHRDLIEANSHTRRILNSFDKIKVVAFGPLAAAVGFIVATRMSSEPKETDVSLAVNVLHPQEFMMKDEKPHVHQLNRLLALAVGPSRLVFMNEQCRSTHQVFLSRDLTSNRVVPVPIDERKARWVRSAEGGPVRIVCVGRIVNFKAYNFALPNILALLTREGRSVTCDIFGYGSEEAKLVDLVNQHGMADTLKFRGPIPLDQFDDIVAEYDLFVGMGTAALHAAQLGVPTILAIADDENGAHGFIHEAPFGNLGEEDASTPRQDLKSVIKSYLDASPEEHQWISELGTAYANRYVSENYIEALTEISVPRRGISRHLGVIYCHFYLWMARDNWLRKIVRFTRNLGRSEKLR